MKVSDRIRRRIACEGASFRANDNIARYIDEGELGELEAEVADGLRAVLASLVIDTENDHNTKETAQRVAKMFVREVFSGRYTEQPSATDFPNIGTLDQITTVGPITIRSACSHHLVPILGSAWIGVLPGERVIGLSKFARVAEWIMSRPQIQEEAVEQLAERLERIIQPKGLAVVVRAKHMCCGWRGVRDDAQSMTSSVMKGVFLEDAEARREFFSLIRAQGF